MNNANSKAQSTQNVIPLVSAAEQAQHGYHYPGESHEYRRARTALLEQEIELRRQIERVAVQRRALPPGGVVPQDYLFMGERGTVKFSEMFAGKQTLITYNWMFGPGRERPCPMCSSLLSGWDGQVPDLEQRVAFAVIATSPIERLVAFKQERGWRHLRLYSSANNNFNPDYAMEKPGGDDNPAFTVFRREGTTVRHFWGAEMTQADPGQDPRGAPDLMPLWNILDHTPEGRGTNWYPELDYKR